MDFDERLEWLKQKHEALITRKNEPLALSYTYR